MSSSPSRAPDLAIAPPLATRVVGGFGTSILAGAALGAAAWFADGSGLAARTADPGQRHRGVARRRVRARRVGPDDPDRGPARGHRPHLGGRRLLRPHRGLRPGLPGDRRVARGDGLGRGRAGRRAGHGRRRRGLAARHAAGRARSGWRLLAAALFAEGFSFGAPRLVHLDQLGTDPGALLFGAEMLLGLALPASSSAAASGSGATWPWRALAIVAALAIGPVTALVRGLADRSEVGVGRGSTGVESPGTRRRPTGACPMKIFLDTADIEEIRTAARWGVLDGVTTNPTPVRQGRRLVRRDPQGGLQDHLRAGVGRGRVRRRRRDARGGPPLRHARPEHRGQGRDVRERPRGDQPLRRRGHQDQLHADLHGQPGPARGQGRRVADLAVRRAGSTTSTRTG